ncbi:amidase family protein [Acuticoccus mangrovi]|uniref:Amidase domain-containing protein n=1 Tax=Acuticoccus mangrovi TaxID=2796142 RepID=A0A934IH12_9HYPH|nr:amidase family protein [Acuticoccus mangrovi]MBJ3776539.1 hypothetical protein [Acuticoccus mangrovi]
MKLDPYGAFVDLAVDPGPGPRVAVKDMIAVEGLLQTAGLATRSDTRAVADAPAVAALRRAGFAIVGTTCTDSAGFGTMTPTVTNPRHPERAVGGSSGGAAAAVAGGLAEVGLGTDTGGSGRIPAAYCDLFAFKPGSRTNLEGVVPLSPTFDSLAVMSDDPGHLAAAAAAITDGWRDAEPSPARWRYDEKAAAFAVPAVGAAFARAVDRLPAGEAAHNPIPCGSLAVAHAVIVCAEAQLVHRDDYVRHPDLFPYEAIGGLSMEVGARELAAARLTIARAREAYSRFMAPDDILVRPTLPMMPAGRHERSVRLHDEDMPITNANIRFTMEFNVARLPVVVVPMEGISLQFVGAQGRDEWLLATVLAAIG